MAWPGEVDDKAKPDRVLLYRKKDCLRTILAAIFCFLRFEYGERGVPADRWPRGPR